MANARRAMQELQAHEDRLKREAEPPDKRGIMERLRDFWGVTQEARAEVAQGPIGGLWDGIYGPRGAAEDIRHKMEQAVYGQQVTPWSFDPQAKTQGRDIYGRETEHDPHALSDAAWNRMEPPSRADLYGRDPQAPEQPDPYSPGIDR